MLLLGKRPTIPDLGRMSNCCHREDGGGQGELFCPVYRTHSYTLVKPKSSMFTHMRAGFRGRYAPSFSQTGSCLDMKYPEGAWI